LSLTTTGLQRGQRIGLGRGELNGAMSLATPGIFGGDVESCHRYSTYE
jgi:hypothetical protein